MTTAKKQDFYDNTGSLGKNADNQHTINPKLAVTLIILQGFALGSLVGLIVILIKEGF
jgi:hypothetical protein